MSTPKRTFSSNGPACLPLTENPGWKLRFCLLAVTFPLALSAFAQEAKESASDPLDQFRARYEEVREEALAPIRQLKSGYAERLKGELEAAKATVTSRVQLTRETLAVLAADG